MSDMALTNKVSFLNSILLTSENLHITVVAKGKVSYLLTARTLENKVLTIFPGMVESG